MISYTVHLKHYKKSFDEALETLKNINKPTAQQNIKIRALNNVLKIRPGRPLPGKIYTYIYNAVGKKKMPYYDRYPLTLVLSVNHKKKTFFGLNLHYLDDKMRSQFIKVIIARSYDKSKDRVITASILSRLLGMAKRMYKECIKQYRIENVLRLAFREISPSILEEINTIDDNTFINRKAIEVHRISRKRIRNITK